MRAYLVVLISVNPSYSPHPQYTHTLPPSPAKKRTTTTNTKTHTKHILKKQKTNKNGRCKNCTCASTTMPTTKAIGRRECNTLAKLRALTEAESEKHRHKAKHEDWMGDNVNTPDPGPVLSRPLQTCIEILHLEFSNRLYDDACERSIPNPARFL